MSVSLCGRLARGLDRFRVDAACHSNRPRPHRSPRYHAGRTISRAQVRSGISQLQTQCPALDLGAMHRLDRLIAIERPLLVRLGVCSACGAVTLSRANELTMSPTWLEIAVAILLLWVAWRLALLLAPWVIRRFRDSRTAGSRTEQNKSRPELINRKD